jgi:hypothetical protein
MLGDGVAAAAGEMHPTCRLAEKRARSARRLVRQPTAERGGKRATRISGLAAGGAAAH